MSKILKVCGKDTDIKYLKMKNLITEKYCVNDVITFNNGSKWNLGNMKGGYPFEICGKRFYTSESAYICGLTDNEEFQNELLNCKNGFVAKKFIKNKHKDLIRKDAENYKVEWMKYVVWCKCCGNVDFKNLLLSTGDKIIVEDAANIKSGTADFWGCKLVDGVYVGGNVMGKILMECRDSLVNGTIPDIDLCKLDDSFIGWFGKKLYFGGWSFWRFFQNHFNYTDEYSFYNMDDEEYNQLKNRCLVDASLD